MFISFSSSPLKDWILIFSNCLNTLLNIHTLPSFVELPRVNLMFVQGIIKVTSITIITHYTFALLKRLHRKDYLQQLERFSEFLPLVTGRGGDKAWRESSVRRHISQIFNKQQTGEGQCTMWIFLLSSGKVKVQLKTEGNVGGEEIQKSSSRKKKICPDMYTLYCIFSQIHLLAVREQDRKRRTFLN